MTDTLRLTLLGTGSSGGVPRVGGDWGVCDPGEPRNRRSRCSLLVQRWNGPPAAPEAATTILIDTSPDMREQLLAAKVRHVDAVLYTHDHADQAHGIDDLRAFVLTHKKRVPVWMDEPTRKTLTHRFGYCFRGMGLYPAILEDAGELKPGEAVWIEGPGGGVGALPLAQDHGGSVSLAFRFGQAAYSNDLVGMPSETMDALAGLDLWIVDALRLKPHPTHAHLAQALDWIEQLKPRRSILTNMHIDLDYRSLTQMLPAGVEAGFDGLFVDLPVSRQNL